MATGIRIRFRRDLLANWDSVNPILEEGELGYVIDKGQFKIGNGDSDWQSLGFFTPGSPDGSILPDSDWIINNAGGSGSSQLDSEWVLTQIADPSSLDSDWVLAQVGDTNSLFYQTLLQTLSVDSEQTVVQTSSSGIDSEWVLSQVGDTNSYFYQTLLETLGGDSEQTSVQTSSSGIDSDWVLAQVGDTNSYFYQTLLQTLQTDSDEPIAAVGGSVPDSEWVLAQIYSPENSQIDSDWVIRQVVLGSVDSDELQQALDTIVDDHLARQVIDSDFVEDKFNEFKQHVDSEWVIRQVIAGSLDSDDLKQSLNEIVDDYLANSIVDSDYVRVVATQIAGDLDSDMDVRVTALEGGSIPTYDSDIKVLQDKDSDYNVRITVLEAGNIPTYDSDIKVLQDTDSDNNIILTTLVNKDSDYNVRITALENGDTSIPTYDSEIAILTNTDSDHDARISALESGESLEIKADSDWIVSQIEEYIDSEVVLRTNADSDLGARIDAIVSGDTPVSADSLDSESVRFLVEGYGKNKTVYVDINGSNIIGDGHQITKPHASVQHALDYHANNQGLHYHLFNGVYPENVEIRTRNISISGAGGAGGSGAYTAINELHSEKTGLKVEKLRITGATNVNNTDSDNNAQNIGNHYNEVIFNGDATFNGQYFHEFHDCKFSADAFFFDSDNHFVYQTEFEQDLVVHKDGANAFTVLSQVNANNIDVQGAGTVFIANDVTASAATSTIEIGPGVIYHLNNVRNFKVNIDQFALRLEDSYALLGFADSEIERLTSSRFSNIILEKPPVTVGNYDVVVRDRHTGKLKTTQIQHDSDWIIGQVQGHTPFFVSNDSDIIITAQNTFIGNGILPTLYTNSTGFDGKGSNNTYVGSNIGATGFLGNFSDNTIVGADILSTTVQTRYNTIVGTNVFNAPGTLQTIDYNVAIGMNIGNGASTVNFGDNNTFIGNDIASVNDWHKYGGNNILVGYQANTLDSEASNQIVLGNADIERVAIPGLGFDTAAGEKGQYLMLDSDGSGNNSMTWSDVDLEINNITNVNITNPAHGEIIAWDSDSQNWVNVDLDARIQAYLDRVAQDGGSA